MTMTKYHRDECVVFRKTKEAFGGLSNMAGGYSSRVSGLLYVSSEHLYQCFRKTSSERSCRNA
jgi:hypothetical protein